MKLKRIASLLCAALVLLVSFASVASAAEAAGVKTGVTAVTLYVGQYTTVTSTLTPTGSTTAKKTWKSASAAIATVDANGKITGKKVGTATVRVTIANGKYADVKVTVKVAPAPSKIAPNAAAATLGVGQTFAAKVTYTPYYAVKGVTWKSSNTKIATVSTSGVIKGIAKGTATITATSQKSSKIKTTLKITVKSAPTKLALPAALSLAVGQTGAPKVTTTPSNAQTTRTWSSSNKAIATVDANGKITPLKKGTVYITVKSYNGKVSNKLKLTVTAKPKPTKIAVDKTAVTLGASQTFKPKLTFTPYYANTGVSYKSSNTKVATVAANGTIKAVAKGAATITVYSTSLKKNVATIKVTVKPALTAIKFNTVTTAAAPAQIGIGQTATPAITVTPTDALNTRKYASGNKAVLTVDANGKVTPKAAGTTYVRVTAWNGITNVIYFKVNPAPSGVKFTQSSVQVLVGKTAAAGLTFTPSNAQTTRTYSGENPKIATVSSSGVITGVALGTTTVSVKTYNGKTANIEVVVTTQAIIDALNKVNAATKAVLTEKPGFTLTEITTTKLGASLSLPSSMNVLERLAWQAAFKTFQQSADFKKFSETATDKQVNTFTKGTAVSSLSATKFVPKDMTAFAAKAVSGGTQYTFAIRNESNIGQSSSINHFDDSSFNTLAALKSEITEKTDAQFSKFTMRSQNVKLIATLNSDGKIIGLQYQYEIVIDASMKGAEVITITSTIGSNQAFSDFVR
ncbi:MAG: Ig-like domain-containing protein [Oscillospiraceae bacterium]|jgi:uncharacterized protein YjdB|nr:Ig-like domain-containing protein [Oscillospiraceae bacterium]